jgi:hypothetical protein
MRIFTKIVVLWDPMGFQKNIHPKVGWDSKTFLSHGMGWDDPIPCGAL